MKRYAKSMIADFTHSDEVSKALSSNDDKAISMISGVLGAIEKGGKAIGSDESASQQAGHYWRILNGIEKGKLDTKDSEKIARLVRGFLSGPKTMRSMSKK